MLETLAYIAIHPDELLPAVGSEDVFDRSVEQRGNFEGKREAGIVSACLDGVHRLARYVKFIGQVALRQVALGSQNAKAVFHQ